MRYEILIWWLRLRLAFAQLAHPLIDFWQNALLRSHESHRARTHRPTQKQTRKMSSITCCAPASSSATRAMMPAAGSTARRTTTRVNAVAPSSTTATTTKTFTVTTKKTATVATTATTTTTAAAAAAVAAVMTWAPQATAATAATAAAAVFEVSEDVFASTGVGPAACALATVFIGYSVFSGYAEIKRLKAELTEEGYDVEEFTRVGELKAIRNAVDEGTVRKGDERGENQTRQPLCGYEYHTA